MDDGTAEKPRTRYQLGPVRDRSQVDPLPPRAETVPLDPPISEPDGDTLAWTLPPPTERLLAGKIPVGEQRQGHSAALLDLRYAAVSDPGEAEPTSIPNLHPRPTR
jgi:hypothetical protein